MAATKMIFHHMVLIFHSFKGSLPGDFQEVFHTTSRKSSTRLPASLLTGLLPYQVESKLVFVEE
uniref:Uncharacterized protein n=1 Tax=Brassica oleracea var. oleracea TaxID=109376 RepID=A0A0D3CER7_BRAOL